MSLTPSSSASRSLLEELVRECHDHLSVAASYLEGRGIGPDTAKRFRLGVVPPDPSPELRPFIGRLAVPSYSKTGAESLRFKLMEGEGPKMLPLRTGDTTRLYWPVNLFEKTNVMAITEGEPDTWVLWQCGIPSVGVVGVNNFKKHHPRLFAGFSDVLVFGDNDDAGRKFARTVVAEIPTARAVIVPSEGSDVNDFYLANGGHDGGAEAVRDLGGL